MGNVPHLWKDKRWSFHFPSPLLELTHFYDFFLTLLIDQLAGENCVQSCPFFLLITLWSKLLCKYPYSHRIFHHLHVLHTLLIFSITFWSEITTVIHNIQHSTPTPLPEINKIHQNRNISDNTTVAIAVTIRKYLLWLKYLQQNIPKTAL